MTVRLLVQPTATGPAPPPDLSGPTKEDLRLRTLRLTAPAGLAGAPVVSLPLARVDGLPLGLALVGLPGDDDDARPGRRPYQFAGQWLFSGGHGMTEPSTDGSGALSRPGRLDAAVSRHRGVAL